MDGGDRLLRRRRARGGVRARRARALRARPSVDAGTRDAYAWAATERRVAIVRPIGIGGAGRRGQASARGRKRRTGFLRGRLRVCASDACGALGSEANEGGGGGAHWYACANAVWSVHAPGTLKGGGGRPRRLTGLSCCCFLSYLVRRRRLPYRRRPTGRALRVWYVLIAFLTVRAVCRCWTSRRGVCGRCDAWGGRAPDTEGRSPPQHRSTAALTPPTAAQVRRRGGRAWWGRESLYTRAVSSAMCLMYCRTVSVSR